MSNMNHQEYDAIIIGGGITGAGVARDCSLRGLKVLLVEKRGHRAKSWSFAQRCTLCSKRC